MNDEWMSEWLSGWLYCIVTHRSSSRSLIKSFVTACHRGRFLPRRRSLVKNTSGTRENKSKYGKSTPWHANSDNLRKWSLNLCVRTFIRSYMYVMSVHILGNRLLYVDCIVKWRINYTSRLSRSLCDWPTWTGVVFWDTSLGNDLSILFFALFWARTLLVIRDTNIPCDPSLSHKRE